MEEPSLNPNAAWFRHDPSEPEAPPSRPRTLQDVYDDATEAMLDSIQREQRMIPEEQTLQALLMRTKSRLREIAASRQRYDRLLEELRDCQESSDRAEELLHYVRQDVRSRMMPPAPLPTGVPQDASVPWETEYVEDLAEARAAVSERLADLNRERQRLEQDLEGLHRQAADTQSHRNAASQDFHHDVSLLLRDINGSLTAVPEGQRHRFRTFAELLTDHSQVDAELLEEIRRSAAALLGISPTWVGGA
jgi:hypothetical protein